MTATASGGILLLVALAALAGPVYAASMPANGQLAAAGTPALTPGELTATAIYGLQTTDATSQIISVGGEPFAKALSVTIRQAGPETNSTQLCMPVCIPVTKGDAILASIYVRGSSGGGADPAQAEFLFERSQPPWRASIAQGVAASGDHGAWKHIVIAFTAVEDYPLDQAQVSLRFGFGPQTIDVGGVSVIDYGTAITLDELTALASEQNPLGRVTLQLHRSDIRQSFQGFGGDFCQPRYGATTPMDKVGEYVLAHLHVAQARVGIPLNVWAPQPGVYKDTGAAHAALLQMQMLARRHIPIIGTVWEGPTWMLPGQPEQSGRTLPPGNYAACAEAIAQFLVTARDKYGATVEDFSFNEANYGVNFLFTPPQICAFIAQAEPRFRALGLDTKFLVGDTTGGMPFSDYARPILTDKAIKPYLGALAFHCWDALSAPEASYREIAQIGRAYGKPVWCTEGGYDSDLWEKPNPWASWTNALSTARAYVRTLRLSGASVIDYWTYENNYPIVAADGVTPYPIFRVISQIARALPIGARIIGATGAQDSGLDYVVATGPDPNEVTAILVNPDGNGTVMLKGLPAGRPVSVTLSDDRATGQAIREPRRVTLTGQLPARLPQRSVVTITVRG